MNLIEKFSNFYSAPFRAAVPIIASEDSSCLESIKARFLFLVQVIIALVAIPFVVFGGAFAAKFSPEGADAENLWCLSLKYLFVVVIPGSFLGIFLPSSTTAKCIRSFDECECCCADATGALSAPHEVYYANTTHSYVELYNDFD
jgi:hypothetical protein